MNGFGSESTEDQVPFVRSSSHRSTPLTRMHYARIFRNIAQYDSNSVRSQTFPVFCFSQVSVIAFAALFFLSFCENRRVQRKREKETMRKIDILIWKSGFKKWYIVNNDWSRTEFRRSTTEHRCTGVNFGRVKCSAQFHPGIQHPNRFMLSRNSHGFDPRTIRPMISDADQPSRRSATHWIP
jgi:hypothetical protein